MIFQAQFLKILTMLLKNALVYYVTLKSKSVIDIPGINKFENIVDTKKTKNY